MAGIKDTKIIKGQPHLLTYITPNEVEKLKALGGQETMTAEGIPAYPEYDNYGFSSQSDFDSGDVSRSNDPNVRGEGPGQNRVTASQLAATNAKEKEAERQKVLAELSVTPFNRNKPLSKFGLYNNQFQKKQNIKLAQKRAFQKYQDIEQYADLMDDYGLTAEEIADKVAANPSYGYDVSKLEKGLETLTSNKGTSIEKTRPNLYDVNSQLKGRFSLLNPVFDKVRPDTQVTAKNTLQKARDYNTLAMDPNISREKLEALANRGKTPEQINPREGGNNQPYLPIDYNTGAATVEAIEPYTNDFTYRFGDTQGIGRDVTLGYLADGGRAGKAEGGIMELRARRAFGGIMDRVTGRKAYGLGSIFKSVGKAVSGVAKAAGKVLSSDVGKMALMAAGTYYMGGGMKFGGAKMFGNTANSTFMGNLGRVGTFIKDNPFKSIGIASAALPFLAGGAKPNEDIGMGNRGGHLIDPLTGKEAKPAEMRASLNNALDNADGDPIRIKQINDAYAFLGPDERLGTYLPYRTYGVKDGGRIGFDNGGGIMMASSDMGDPKENAEYHSQRMFGKPYKSLNANELEEFQEEMRRLMNKFMSNGGRINRAEGGLLDLGGMEKDYRAEGGFVPIGEYEKKDDVPARLSVNEFVFTADAVRGAGQGDIDKGAEIMENMMKNLEKGGTISEESQGNIGAQQMFETSERLGEVI